MTEEPSPAQQVCRVLGTSLRPGSIWAGGAPVDGGDPAAPEQAEIAEPTPRVRSRPALAILAMAFGRRRRDPPAPPNVLSER
jgi:hypothetical protein